MYGVLYVSIALSHIMVVRLVIVRGYSSRSFVCSLSSISTATCMYRPYSTSEFLNTKLLPVFFQPTKLKWLVFEISSNALICRQL